MSAQSPAKLAQEITTESSADGELSDTELDQVAGGFNPQPDPPGRVAKAQSSLFVSALASKGIIIIGG